MVHTGRYYLFYWVNETWFLIFFSIVHEINMESPHNEDCACWMRGLFMYFEDVEFISVRIMAG